MWAAPIDEAILVGGLSPAVDVFTEIIIDYWDHYATKETYIEW